MMISLTCMLLALGQTALAAQAGTDDPNPAANVKMKYGDPDRLGRPFAKDPHVIRHGGRYLMYYSICSYAKERVPPGLKKNGWAIGIAESTNLVDWKKAGEITPVQECEANGLVNGAVIKLDGKLHLFYNTYGNGKNDALCHATSEDGLKWDRDPTNPIFRPKGDWNSGRAIDLDVMEHEGKLWIYFATRDPSMKVQMLTLAQADRKSDLGRSAWKQVGEGPILKPELPWEKKCIEAPAIHKRDGKIYLFYGGGYNNDPQQIGCAVSADGLTFERLFVDKPLLPNGPAGSWNASESGHPGIFVDDDGEVYMFFQANNDNGKTWYLSWVKIGFKDGKPFIKKE